MPTTLTTLTGSPKSWVYPGSAAKTPLSEFPLSTSASLGTYRPLKSRSTWTKNKNTYNQSGNGRRAMRTPLRTWRHCMVSSDMLAQSSPMVVLSSLDWKPCSQPVMIIHSCLIPLLKVSEEIWNGGLQPFANPSLGGLSLDQSNSAHAVEY